MGLKVKGDDRTEYLTDGTQVRSDGKTCWVNDRLGFCLGRYTNRMFEVWFPHDERKPHHLRNDESDVYDVYDFQTFSDLMHQCHSIPIQAQHAPKK